ncbi:Undecaprenyl-diphosphatase [Candidatus Entotheonellaceae bacterium PAL068K]
MQGLVITPGISRSGSTIVVAFWCGFRRELAARFSFLIAIPTILEAMLLQFDELGMVSAHQAGLLIGCLSSALVVGYLALRWLLRLLMRENFWPFAIYCWLLGIGAILASL